MRDKIKLVSTAGTGYFIPPLKISVPCLAKWKSKNLIQKFANMYFLKKQKSNN